MACLQICFTSIARLLKSREYLSIENGSKILEQYSYNYLLSAQIRNVLESSSTKTTENEHLIETSWNTLFIRKAFVVVWLFLSVSHFSDCSAISDFTVYITGYPILEVSHYGGIGAYIYLQTCIYICAYKHGIIQAIRESNYSLTDSKVGNCGQWTNWLNYAFDLGSRWAFGWYVFRDSNHELDSFRDHHGRCFSDEIRPCSSA